MDNSLILFNVSQNGLLAYKTNSRLAESYQHTIIITDLLCFGKKILFIKNMLF